MVKYLSVQFESVWVEFYYQVLMLELYIKARISWIEVSTCGTGEVFVLGIKCHGLIFDLLGIILEY